MAILAAPMVDTDALWKIILVAFAGGRSDDRLRTVVAWPLPRQTKNPARRLANFALSGLAGLFCVAAVGLGIYAMTKKPATAKPTPKAAALVHRTTF